MLELHVYEISAKYCPRNSRKIAKRCENFNVNRFLEIFHSDMWNREFVVVVEYITQKIEIYWLLSANYRLNVLRTVDEIVRNHGNCTDYTYYS